MSLKIIKAGTFILTVCLILTLHTTILKGSEKEKSKIAIVNMEYIFKNFYKTKINSAKFNKQAAVFKEYADQLAASQLKLEEEFRAYRDASQNIALSETERESKRLAARDKYRQLQAKQNELETYNQEKSAQLKEQYEKMRRDLLLEIRKCVAKYANDNHFEIVIDASGNTTNDIPLVLYYKPEMNISDDILKILNKGVNKK
jgi:Skp family chaperone for outer membrane proteins